MKFKGTIIITDPCYIIKDDAWVSCVDFEALGIEHYICEDTLYGDWGCTTYRTSKNPIKAIDDIAGGNQEPYKTDTPIIGKFTADIGLVGVFLLEEVRKHNPNIDEWIEKNSRFVTTIKDFDGNVEYYIDDNDDAHIYGIGNINFFTEQTSL